MPKSKYRLRVEWLLHEKPEDFELSDLYVQNCLFIEGDEYVDRETITPEDKDIFISDKGVKHTLLFDLTGDYLNEDGTPRGDVLFSPAFIEGKDSSQPSPNPEAKAWVEKKVGTRWVKQYDL